MSYVASQGVTKVHTMVTVDCACGLWPKNLGKDAHLQDMDVAYEELEIYSQAHAEGRLRTRIRAALPVASWKRLLTEVMRRKPHDATSCETQREYVQDHWLQVGSLKAMIDGSLGTHTAAFFDDYADSKGNNGHLIWDPMILESYVRDASANNLQVCVHAIGDKANRLQLDIFEKITREQPTTDHRYRIEHAQHIAPNDIKRFGELGVIASLQMSHLADDGRWAESVIGKRRCRFALLWLTILCFDSS